MSVDYKAVAIFWCVMVFPLGGLYGLGYTSGVPLPLLLPPLVAAFLIPWIYFIHKADQQ